MKRETLRENSTETCIGPYVKQMNSPSSMHEAGHSKLVHWTTQRDGMGREVGGGFRMGDTCTPWLIHVNVWQKPLQHCKVINLQLK